MLNTNYIQEDFSDYVNQVYVYTRVIKHRFLIHKAVHLEAHSQNELEIKSRIEKNYLDKLWIKEKYKFTGNDLIPFQPFSTKYIHYDKNGYPQACFYVGTEYKSQWFKCFWYKWIKSL